jgi:signal transduction histidine kinase
VTPNLPLRLPAGRPAQILAVGAVLTLILVALAQLDPSRNGRLWAYAHWNVSAITAFVAVLASIAGTRGTERRVRIWAAATLGVWMTYNVTYAVLALTEISGFPGIADAFGLFVFVPAIGALIESVRGRLTWAEETAVYLDAAIMAAAVFAILLVVFGPTAYDLGGLRGVLVFAYPLEFLAIALSGTVALVAVRYHIGPYGAAALLAGSAIVGLAYLTLVVGRAGDIAFAADLSGPLFSIGALVAGFGGVTWRDEIVNSARFVARASFLARSLGPLAAGLTFLAVLPESTRLEPLEGFLRIAVLTAGALVLIRQGLLLRERSRMLTEVQVLHDENDRLVGELRNELAERARVQDQLVNTSRMAAVGELAAGVAHEVNNPLTGVLGYAEILLLDTDDDDPRRKDLETIRSEALRARGIVRALRDFARPKTPEPVPTDLGELVTRTVDLVRYPLVESGITIIQSLADMGLVQVDPDAIQQVLLNVLTNAMQAMPDGGRLVIETATDGGDVIIKIADDGVGMDESVAAQAFVPFFSGRPSANASGLGLSVSLGLVESHRGTLTLRSAPNAGTIVEIRLPRVAATPVTIAPRGEQ